MLLDTQLFPLFYLMRIFLNLLGMYVTEYLTGCLYHIVFIFDSFYFGGKRSCLRI
jgi:hypothetical protein